MATNAVRSFVVNLALLLLSTFACHAEAAKRPPAKPLDLNSATAEQLQELPGIGPTTAAAIVAFREKSGPFRRVEDLLAIHGISKKKLEAIRPYVFIAPPVKSTWLLFFDEVGNASRAG
jgi:competence ComEA-like helix-hairpin-helix protein